MMQAMRYRARAGAAFAAAALLLGACVHAQNSGGEPGSTPPKRGPELIRTFFLKNTTTQNDLNDIQTDLRNVLARIRAYGVAGQSAITILGTAEELDQAQALINELDKPRKTYRITYAVTEFDGGKRLEAQHYSLMAVAENGAELKQGTRVPVFAGKSKGENEDSAQVQYVDVGLYIRATVYGVSLHSRIETSSVADQPSPGGGQDPVIRQRTLDTSNVFTLGKAMLLGSMDVPGSTHRFEIEAVIEAAQ